MANKYPLVLDGTSIEELQSGDAVAGLIIGTDVQAYDAGLQSIAGLTTAADKMIYTTALDVYAVTDLTAAGRALLDDADASAQRTTLGLAIGTNVQAYDPGLTSIAGLTTTADRMIYTTASDVYAVTTLTAAGRAILDDADAAAQRTTLGLAIGTNVQAYDPGLQSIAGLTTTADRMIYTTASDTYAVTTLTAAGRAILDDADATAQRATLGLVIGTDVQAYDPDTAKLDVVQSFTAQQTFKEVKDTVHTITDGAGFEIDPANGSIQVVTLGADRTPAATNFEAGQVVLLGVDDGSNYNITWTTVNPTWVKVGGTASAPSLADSGYTWILLWKVSTTIYATEVGSP
jgi:hypothetical protein